MIRTIAAAATLSAFAVLALPAEATTGPGCLTVVNVAANDTLSVRDEASAKSPVTRRLQRGDKIEIIGEAINGKTKWLKIASDDGGAFVSAAYVTLT